MRKVLATALVASMIPLSSMATEPKAVHPRTTIHKKVPRKAKGVPFTFEKRKGIVLKDIDGKIEILQDEKVCAESSNNTRAIRKCERKARFSERKLRKTIRNMWRKR